MGGRFGELLLLLIVVLLLFGPSKLPDLARNIGHALNEFKKAANPTPESPQPQAASQPALAAAPVSQRRRRAPARRRSKR